MLWMYTISVCCLFGFKSASVHPYTFRDLYYHIGWDMLPYSKIEADLKQIWYNFLDATR